MRSRRRPTSMRWGDPLPKRSSTSDSVARWIPGGKSPLAVKGGKGTSSPRWYRVHCVILPQVELLLTPIAYVSNGVRYSGWLGSDEVWSGDIGDRVTRLVGPQAGGAPRPWRPTSPLAQNTPGLADDRRDRLALTERCERDGVRRPT